MKPSKRGAGAVNIRMAFTVAFACVVALWSAPRARADDALNIVVTIKPVHSLVAMVLNGIATPELLVEGQASPHSFSLRPSDAQALSGAHVVVRVSPSVEPFTVKIAEALAEATTLVTLAEAPGVELLPTRTGTDFQSDGGHDAHSKDGAGLDKPASTPDQDHDHGHDAAHDHEHGAFDGHIWLGPDNAKAIIRQVATVLSTRRPDLKSKLDANAAAALATIDALDAELKTALAPVSSKTFIVFHDAYQYFERHYGLHAAGSITLNPEVQPSARRLSEIRATLEKNAAACVFAEPQFSSRIIATVIEGTHAKAGTLDPLGADIPPGPAHYPALMRALSQAMAGCLGKAG